MEEGLKRQYHLDFPQKLGVNIQTCSQKDYLTFVHSSVVTRLQRQYFLRDAMERSQWHFIMTHFQKAEYLLSIPNSEMLQNIIQ